MSSQRVKACVLICLLLVVLSGCALLNFDATPTPPALTVRTDLTGRLIIFDRFNSAEAKAFEYVNGKGFMPLAVPLLRQHVLPEEYDPSISPDGKWQIVFDKPHTRFVVLDTSNMTHQHIIQEWIISLWQIAWSPDSRFLIYSAGDQQGEWFGRIILVDVHDGWKTSFLGYGFTPRWLDK